MDRTRPRLRPCASGIPLAPSDLPAACAQGAAAPERHSLGGPVEELTGSRRASAAAGLFPVQSGGHAPQVRGGLNGNRGEGHAATLAGLHARDDANVNAVANAGHSDRGGGPSAQPDPDDDDPDAHDPHRAARGVITGMLMGCAAYGLLVAAVWLSQKLGEWLL